VPVDAPRAGLPARAARGRERPFVSPYKKSRPRYRGVFPRYRRLSCDIAAVQTRHLSGSFYTSPNAPNVRTLNGHIEISLGDVASAGMLGQWNFSMAVQRSDVRGVRAGVE